MQREMSYTSIKLGAYAPVRDAIGAGKDSPFYMKFLAGAITGGVGSVVGNVSGYANEKGMKRNAGIFHSLNRYFTHSLNPYTSLLTSSRRSLKQTRARRASRKW